MCACAAAGIDPMIAMCREAHHPTLDERFAGPPSPPPKTPRRLRRWTIASKRPRARRSRLAQADPRTGVRHHQVCALGFRQFLLRGLDNVRGEWSLVTMAWNVKQIFVLAGAT